MSESHGVGYDREDEPEALRAHRHQILVPSARRHATRHPDFDLELLAADVQAEIPPKKPPETPPAISTTKGRRFLTWLIFGLLFGLLPIMMEIMHQAESGHWDFGQMLGKGEQFVISAVISAGAVGELISADIPESEGTRRVGLVGSTLLSFVANLAAYNCVQSAPVGTVVVLSILLCPTALFLSALCIRMAGDR